MTVCLSACLYGRNHDTYLDGLLLLSRSMLVQEAGVVLVVWHDKHVGVSCRSSVCTAACVPVYWKQMPAGLDAEWKMSTRILTLQFAEAWGIDHVIMTDLDVCDLCYTAEVCEELQRRINSGRNTSFSYIVPWYSHGNNHPDEQWQGVPRCGGGCIALSAKWYQNTSSGICDFTKDKINAWQVANASGLNPTDRQRVRSQLGYGLDEYHIHLSFSRDHRGVDFLPLPVTAKATKSNTRRCVDKIHQRLRVRGTSPTTRVAAVSTGTPRILLTAGVLDITQLEEAREALARMGTGNGNTGSRKEPDKEPPRSVYMFTGAVRHRLQAFVSSLQWYERVVPSLVSARQYDCDYRSGLCEHVDDCDVSVVVPVRRCNAGGDLILTNMPYNICMHQALLGAAVAWTRGLSHEVTEVTEGTRATVVSLWNERPVRNKRRRRD